MRKFVFRTLLFSLPVLLLWAFVLVLYFVVGEQKAYRNDGGVEFVSFMDNSLLVDYKFDQATKEKHKILAIGTSRVLQFREEMFNYSFYNMGLMITSLYSVNQLLHQIPKSKLPEIIVLGIDQRNLNHHYQSVERSRSHMPFAYKNLTWTKRLELFTSAIKNNQFIPLIVENYDRLISSEQAGLNAKLRLNGFRKDGSQYNGYGMLLHYKNKTDYDWKFKTQMDRIEKQVMGYQSESSLEKGFVEDFKEIVKFTKDHNIHLVAFFPPYANSVWEAYNHKSDLSFIEEATKVFNELCDNNSSFFFDFTYMENTGDGQYLDGFHGSEIVYHEILQHMEKNEQLHNLGFINRDITPECSFLNLFEKDSIRAFDEVIIRD